LETHAKEEQKATVQKVDALIPLDETQQEKPDFKAIEALIRNLLTPEQAKIVQAKIDASRAWQEAYDTLHSLIEDTEEDDAHGQDPVV
jgi:hypothetical protein